MLIKFLSLPRSCWLFILTHTVSLFLCLSRAHTCTQGSIAGGENNLPILNAGLFFLFLLVLGFLHCCSACLFFLPTSTHDHAHTQHAHTSMLSTKCASMLLGCENKTHLFPKWCLIAYDRGMSSRPLSITSRKARNQGFLYATILPPETNPILHYRPPSPTPQTLQAMGCSFSELKHTHTLARNEGVYGLYIYIFFLRV